MYYHRYGGRGLQNRAEEHRMDRQEDGVMGVVPPHRGGGLGRSKIDCLAGVQEVGNRLLLNECVDKVFGNQTEGLFSLNITGQ